MKAKRVKADTSRVLGDLNEQLQKSAKVRPSVAGVGGLPFDLPMYLSVERLLIPSESHNPPKMFSQILVGHKITLDFWLTKTLVEIRVMKNPRAILIKVDGKVAHRWTRDEADIPRGIQAIIEITEDDAKWVEQVDLQPGDEVEADENGEYVIKRAGQISPAEKFLADTDAELSEILGIPSSKLYERKNGEKRKHPKKKPRK